MNGDDVFITPAVLHRLMHSDAGVTILDARHAGLRHSGEEPGSNGTIPGIEYSHWPLLFTGIEGSYRCSWESFLKDPPPLTQMKSPGDMIDLFRECGVCNEVPVVVFGRWHHGDGDEGRICWQLDYLGHRHTHILAGGISAWLHSGLNGRGRLGKGDLTAMLRPECFATCNDVQQVLRTHEATIVDTRTLDEFNGVDDYRSKRHGHIPTAIHYDWYSMKSHRRPSRPSVCRRNVFTGKQGPEMLPCDVLRDALGERGISPEKRIIVYCARGIRSAFLYVVLKSIGFSNVANYAGSFFEYAADPHLPVESSTA